MLNSIETPWLRSTNAEKRRRKNSLGSKEKGKRLNERERRIELPLERDLEYSNSLRRYNLR
jgi:hypothetical protein